MLLLCSAVPLGCFTEAAPLGASRSESVQSCEQPSRNSLLALEAMRVRLALTLLLVAASAHGCLVRRAALTRRGFVERLPAAMGRRTGTVSVAGAAGAAVSEPWERGKRGDCKWFHHMRSHYSSHCMHVFLV